MEAIISVYSDAGFRYGFLEDSLLDVASLRGAMTPRISVVIPLYNREQYIEECVKSVITTQYPNLEIVVVDDGSLDNGPTIVQKLIDLGHSNIRLLFHLGKVNKGVSASRNLGVHNCKGAYVTFLDSDDVMNPWRFAVSPALLNNHSSVDAVFESHETFDDSGVIKERLVVMEGGLLDYITGRLRYDLPGIPSTGSLLFRKDIFEKSGLFDERKDVGEDFDLWFRVYAVGIVVPDNRAGPVCRYRKHAENTFVANAHKVHLDGFSALYHWASSHKCNSEKCNYLRGRYIAYVYDYFGAARSEDNIRREREILVHVMMHLPSLFKENRFVRCWMVYFRDLASRLMKRIANVL